MLIKNEGLVWKVAALLIVAVVVIDLGSATCGERGKDWNKYDKRDKIMYLIGFSDGLIHGSVHQQYEPHKVDAIAKCTNDWTYGQGLAVIDKYLNENPHKWDQSLGDLVWEAYTDACKKRVALR